MVIQIEIINKFGNFKGKYLSVTIQQYTLMTEMSKGFYQTGFEMETEDGFLIIPPDIVKDSILKINIINKDDV